MFDPTRIRMNNIYGSLGPPSDDGFNFENLLNFVREQRMTEQNQRDVQEVKDQASQLAQKWQKMPTVDQGGSMGNPQDRNVVFQPGPNLLDKWRAQDIEDKELKLKEKAIDATTGYKNAQLDLGQQKVDISRGRAAAYDFKSRNPNSKFITGKDGRLRAIDPQTNEVTDLGETGMSDQEIILLNQQNRMEQIGAQGQNALATQGLRNEGALANIAATAAGRPEKVMPPTQKRTELNNAARMLMNTRPDLKKYIEFDPNTGDFTNTAPPDSPEYSFINAQLYKRGDTNLPVENKKQEALSIDQNQRIKVEKNGKQFTVPASQLKDAIAQGYKEIK